MGGRSVRLALAFCVIVVACGSLVLAAVGASPVQVVLGEGFERVAIGTHMELAYDEGGEASIDDVLAGKLQFTPSTKEVPNFGYRTGAEWLHLRAKDERARTGELVLEHGYGLTDRIELFEVAGGTVVRRALGGDHVAPRDWDVLARLPAFELKPRGEHEVYVRVTSGESHMLLFSLFSAHAYQEHRRFDLAAQCVYFGALAAMLIYNAMLGVGARGRTYGYYVGFLASYGVFQLAFSGFGPVGFGITGALVDVVPAITIGIFGSFGMTFARGLLDLDRVAPRWSLLSRRFVIVIACVTPVAPVFGYTKNICIMLGLALIWAPLMVALGLAAQGQGVRVARLYLIAWAALLVAAITEVLKNLGVLPVNVFTTNAIQVGSAVEFLLLPLALADRIKQLQVEATSNAELAAKNAQLAAENAEAARAATERALAEQERANTELQRMDKLKDDFLANTSHELRTPLNGMLGLVETTLGGAVGPIPSPVKRNLELVRASGRRLAALVNDILDFSKLREKNVALRSAPVALYQVADLTLQTLTTLAGDKGLRLVNAISESLGALADENRLQQILMNLVGNAIKFTPAGSVTVSAMERDGRVVVSVQDTGIGIPKESQSRIFESFEQADGSTAREYGGTGLGLTVTKQLVELHGGQVVVESEPGNGSTFSFDLACSELPEKVVMAPRVLFQETPSIAHLAAVADAPLPAALSQGLRVLVVDDEPINREVLAQHLTAKGFEIIHAQDGVQAIESIQRDKPDLVLLDVMMPKKTGYDVLEAVRPMLEAAELPVLLLTAKAQESDLKHGFSLGASDYLLKPVSLVELDARLGHHVRLVRSSRALSSTLAGLETTVAERTAELRKALELLDLDLHAAKRFQDVAMRMPHELGEFVIGSRSEPCGVVGGDFMDVTLIAPGHLRVLVADATGHGVQAALRTMVIKTAYDGIKLFATKPSECLTALNLALVEAYPDLEAKTDAACVDVLLEEGGAMRVRVSTAGAMTALIGDGDARVSEMQVPGYPLGVAGWMNFREMESVFTREARVCLFTDGISEQEGPDGKMYDFDRVEAQIAQIRGPSETVEGLFAHWREFRGEGAQDDDASVLVIAAAVAARL